MTPVDSAMCTDADSISAITDPTPELVDIDLHCIDDHMNDDSDPMLCGELSGTATEMRLERKDSWNKPIGEERLERKDSRSDQVDEERSERKDSARTHEERRERKDSQSTVLKRPERKDSSSLMGDDRRSERKDSVGGVKRKDPEEYTPSSSVERKDHHNEGPIHFIELFAGVGGLHDTLVDSFPEFCALKRDKLTDGWDLCNDDDLATIVRYIDRGVIWLHGAPPCSTFSRARRNDHHGSCKVLRTEDTVYGFGDPAAEEANTLAIRMFALAEQQHGKGRYFSIENPWESLMWNPKEAQRVEKLPGVVRCFINQCAYGSPFKKDTAILTNAPWLIGKERVCADVATHKHVPLCLELRREQGDLVHG
jgi:hypothetical protein